MIFMLWCAFHFCARSAVRWCSVTVYFSALFHAHLKLTQLTRIIRNAKPLERIEFYWEWNNASEFKEKWWSKINDTNNNYLFIISFGIYSFVLFDWYASFQKHRSMNNPLQQKPISICLIWCSTYTQPFFFLHSILSLHAVVAVIRTGHIHHSACGLMRYEQAHEYSALTLGPEIKMYANKHWSYASVSCAQCIESAVSASIH